MAASVVAAAKKLQEQLLAWREEALAMQEENVRILEKALAKVSADLDTERAKAEATQKSTMRRWRLMLPMPCTHTASIRCWGRRRLSSMGESGT
jgi:hypothetical protein